jgi:SHS family lactate transporter-like MFS transporter
MNTFAAWRKLNRDQRNAFIAAFLGWALDAFDYFLLVFVIKDVGKEFHASDFTVSLATLLTLAFRPVGALIFGVIGDRYGRRLPLMADIVLYSFLELITGFAPNMTAFLVIRALFGIGMGGEWGLGSSLALETLPADVRGMFSGLLQEGYSFGYLLASIVFGIAFPYTGWRGLFVIGAFPALLSLFIRASVKESPAWQAGIKREPAVPVGSVIAANGRLFIYVVLLMTAFNFMSHGTQDVYPLFLQRQHRFPPHMVSVIAVTYNIGAIIGGWFFGSLSQRIGRRKAIIWAALLGIPLIPLWAFSKTAVLLAIGAFLIQFMVQGAWGVIPAHLTELAPAMARGTFIGVAYQTGNLIASINSPLEIALAKHWHGNLGVSLASVVFVVFLCVALITSIGKERKGVDLVDAPH